MKHQSDLEYVDRLLDGSRDVSGDSSAFWLHVVQAARAYAASTPDGKEAVARALTLRSVRHLEAAAPWYRRAPAPRLGVVVVSALVLAAGLGLILSGPYKPRQITNRHADASLVARGIYDNGRLLSSSEQAGTKTCSTMRGRLTPKVKSKGAVLRYENPARVGVR